MSELLAPSSPEKQPPANPAPHVGHETKDANPWKVVIFSVGLFLLMLASLPLVTAIFNGMEAQAKRADRPPSQIESDQTPPLPRLQATPRTALSEFKAEQQQRLTTYGWNDAKHKSVHLPVDRAIQLLAERGIPEPKAPEVPKPAPALAKGAAKAPAGEATKAPVGEATKAPSGAAAEKPAPPQPQAKP